MSGFDDIQKLAHEFNVKVQLPEHLNEIDLNMYEMQPRANKLLEEIEEFKQAFISKNIEETTDALIDTIYVAIGFLNQMGVRIQPVFEAIHKNNMCKKSGGCCTVTKINTHVNINKLLNEQLFGKEKNLYEIL